MAHEIKSTRETYGQKDDSEHEELVSNICITGNIPTVKFAKKV